MSSEVVISEWTDYAHGKYRRFGSRLQFNCTKGRLILPEHYTYQPTDFHLYQHSELGKICGEVGVIGWETKTVTFETKENPVSKFKVGQKVYDIVRGLGEINDTNSDYSYGRSIEAIFVGRLVHFTPEGKVEARDLNPTLLTLEEARAKGYDVPKQKIVKEKTVYINLYEDYIFGKFSKEEMTREYNQNAILNSYPVTIKYEVEE